MKPLEWSKDLWYVRILRWLWGFSSEEKLDTCKVAEWTLFAPIALFRADKGIWFLPRLSLVYLLMAVAFGLMGEWVISMAMVLAAGVAAVFIPLLGKIGRSTPDSLKAALVIFMAAFIVIALTIVFWPWFLGIPLIVVLVFLIVVSPNFFLGVGERVVERSEDSISAIVSVLRHVKQRTCREIVLRDKKSPHL